MTGRTSLQARLMATVFAIVAAILLVVSLVTSALLTTVLNQTLDDRLEETVKSLGPEFGLHAATGDAVGQLQESRAAPGTVLLFGTDPGTATGAYVDHEYEVEPLSRRQITQILTGVTDSGPHTVNVTDLGTFRVQALIERSSGSAIGVMGLENVTESQTLARMLWSIALVTVGGMIGLGVATTIVIRRGLRPLRDITETAARVSRQKLDQGAVSITERVPPEQADPSTEVGQVGASLNTLLDHVEHSLAARERNEATMRRFVADASHELRTPLASIRGYSELSLRDRTLSDTTEQSLERIQAQSIRMTGLVEDLLLLARLDEGREVQIDAVDLTQVAVDALGDQQVAAPEHVWSVEADEEPLIVAGDSGRLSQVFVNLLANARTHTPAGTEVTLRVRREGSGSATRAVVQVHDNGPGISPELQAEMFSRFARGDVSRARKTGGTGLGLAIAKAIVEAHHGTIEVRSEPGDTTFEIRLPAKPL
nr:ATP-binding protein [Microbacterium halophytorum]